MRVPFRGLLRNRRVLIDFPLKPRELTDGNKIQPYTSGTELALGDLRIQQQPSRWFRRCAQMRPSRLLLYLSGLLFLCTFTPKGNAQISPGPLAKQHQFLDGAMHCTDCHKIGGGKPEFRCIGCHSDIGARIAGKRGLHASYHIPAGSSQECVRCHSDHNGPNFPLIKWDPKKFDHKETGYLLEGKHAGLECNKCHLPEKIPSAERATIKVKDLSKSFLGIPQTCTACHKDFHEGRLGPNCITCHNFVDWKDTSGKFDHSKTRYPLTGLHQQVKCEKCHTPDSDRRAALQGPAVRQVR